MRRDSVGKKRKKNLKVYKINWLRCNNRTLRKFNHKSVDVARLQMRILNIVLMTSAYMERNMEKPMNQNLSARNAGKGIKEPKQFTASYAT